MDRAITTTEADIVKASNCQATVCANIHKEFLLPPLLQTTASPTKFKIFHYSVSTAEKYEKRSS
jgi:hypothetical protein